MAISTRTSPAGARSMSPLTVTIVNGPGPSSRPATLRSPLVVVAWSDRSVAGAQRDVARDGSQGHVGLAGGHDVDVAGHGLDGDPAGDGSQL